MARLTEIAVNAAVDAVTVLLDGGKLCLYDGEQPTNDKPVSQIAIATLKFSELAFEPAVNGEAAALPIEPDESAARTGTATWFRCYGSDGRAIFDGSVGDGNESDLNLDNTKIQIRARVSISRLVYSQGA